MIYSPDQFSNARKRVHQQSQPTITAKFAKVEKKGTGVDLAVEMLRKLPGMALSNFDSEHFLRPWADEFNLLKRCLLEVRALCFKL